MSRNEKQHALVPRVRFPEFRDKEGWKRRPLSDVLSEHGLKSTGVEQVYSVSVHKGLVNQIEHLGRRFSASSTDHYNLVLPWDIVYTKSPTGDFPLGIIKQNKTASSVIVSPLYGVFSPESIALGVILDAYFESPANAKYYLEPLVQKGAKNTINVNNSKFLSGNLILPLKEEEQQKIADCLGSLDDLIGAELRDHKKGLMQQLFPREGETRPRLRFLEFRDTEGWVEQKLSEILTEHGLKSTGGEEVFSVSVHKGLVNQIEHLGRSYSAEKTDHYNRVLPGDVVYTKSPTGEFPLGVIKQSQVDCQVIVSPLYGVFTPESVAVGRLIDAYFSSPYNAKAFLAPIVNKGAKNTINVANAAFLSKKLLLPRTRKEQQKIADCLSTLDALTAAQASKLDALRTHKRGLMQQLFPSPEDAGT